MYETLERRSFLAMLLVVSLAFLFLMKPFVGPIFWAVAIALIFNPVQQWMLRKMPGRLTLTSVLTLLICLIIVVIPVIVLVSSLVAEGVGLFQKIQAGEIQPGAYIDQISQSFPAVQSFLDRFNIDIDRLREGVVATFVGGSKLLAKQALGFGQNTFQFLLSLSLMFYLAFFLLRDGTKLVDMLIRALPLGDERERLLFAKFAEVTRATVKGNLLVAVIQGALGGFIFWALGISGALLWGVVMALASLIPAVGAALVWVPAAIYLAAIGDYASAIILTAFGMLVIGLADNLLRPILVGRDTKLPDYMVLLSTLGGIAMFGINGFVMGPLVAALFVAFWGIFIREFNSPQ
ncbi:MAG: AI-2E family transporter [Alteromonadaceae bacterium]|uniref:AI-2E family transporter n=1 Tax=unclassified Marinobacter TaxID=83889 RepID=UPI000C4C397C|nr:AI-2E family transporter [Marinobacter sp. BGYM27]MAA64635.1 AI-2E family transporter [Alteromonadaceae bacterium]MBH84661.1 AI-2E family transporter [Alteromonadaceae bacterium]MDG5498140.1 AI-2E family transporter [Marinobacter sp. BGYM27]|tara:strand:- start:57947 stop:58993 length:1047 start_codon:yes stop_codon:yes gene_type:complete